MKDEIKEKLDKMERLIVYGQYNAYYDLEKQLLDNITNLQEKNKELKKKITFNEKSRRKMQQSLMEQIEIYKSRNEKAIEYIMTELITEWDIKNDGYVSGSDLPVDAITPLLNILNGGDEE